MADSFGYEEQEIVAQNSTLDGLLRKLEDGDFINHGGNEVQALLVKLRQAALKRGKSTGKIVIELKIHMGRDGYALTVGSIECKTPKAPARPESTLYVDTDGDINGKPVPKQTTIFDVSKKSKDVAAPAAKGM